MLEQNILILDIILLKKKLIKVEYVSTEDMLADIFTKAVPRI
jgi:hypothetical protein